MSQEKELIKEIRRLSQTYVQIVIQSRLGERRNYDNFRKSETKCIFSLDTDINVDIQAEYKKNLAGGSFLTNGNPLCIEILLETKDKEVMPLEVWTFRVSLSMLSAAETNKLLYWNNIYSRMAALLKATANIAHLTPAWSLSFQQKPDDYVLLYKLYPGEPVLQVLGPETNSINVASINVMLGTIDASVTYTTNLTFKFRRPSQMMLKSDHFKAEMSPKHNKKKMERPISVDYETVDEVQVLEGARPNVNSPYIMCPNVPRSRTSSESSNNFRGSQGSIQSEKTIAAFYNHSPGQSDEYLKDEESLDNMIEYFNKTPVTKESKKAERERRISESKLMCMAAASSRQEKKEEVEVSTSLPKDVSAELSLFEGLSSMEAPKFFCNSESDEILGMPCDDLPSFSGLGDNVTKLALDLDQMFLNLEDHEQLVRSFQSETESVNSSLS